MNCCKRYRISGRVQGVAFRASARHEATRLGVTGWVRNLVNGDVEALACGTDEQLRTFETWLHRGPAAARVDSVHATVEDNVRFERFEIR